MRPRGCERSLSNGDHCETREPGSGSRIDVQFAVLHPRKRMKPTAIESHVQSFICHHDRKHRSISGANWSDPTVWWARPEQMKRISSGEKTCDNHDYCQRSLPSS